MARTNTSKLKLPKHDIGDLNWGYDFNEGLDALDAHCQRETLRPPRTLTAQLGSGAAGAYLLGNTTYYYKVTAINQVGETTEGRLPAVLEASVTQGATPVPVVLEWEAVEGASGYRVYKASSSGAEEFLVEKAGGSTVTHTDDGNTDTTATVVPGSNTALASVTGIRKTGEAAPLRGDVKLKEGANVTLTQTPGTNEIEIAAVAGGVGEHALGGSAHTPDTLANLNSKLSDATLVDQAAMLLQALADAKGDLIAASGPDAWSRLGVGTDGEVLTADTASPAGVKWAAAAGGGGGGYATVVVDDPTGIAATDAANIQSALDNLPAAGGKIVLREGTYALNAELILPAGKPVWVQGQGRGTVLQTETGCNKVFKNPAAGDVRGVLLSDFHLDATTAGSSLLNLQPGATQTFEDLVVERVHALSVVDLVYMGAFTSGGAIRRVRIANCHLQDSAICFANNLAGTTLEHIEILDNICHETPQTADPWVEVSGDHWTIQGNIMLSSTGGQVNEGGIRIRGNQPSQFVNIVGNVVKHQGLISQDSSGSVLRKSIIAFNINEADASIGQSISLGDFEVSDCLFIGNRINLAFVVQVGGSSGNNVYLANTQQPTAINATDTLGHVPQSLASAKGDLAVATAARTFGKLGIGADGQILTADSAQTAGIKWADPAGGGGYATQVVAAPLGGIGDAAAIQNAVNALPANGGAVVLREGTYQLDAQVTIPAGKRVWIRGQGRATKLTLDATFAGGLSSQGVFQGPGTGDIAECVFSDMELDGAGITNTLSGWFKFAPASGQTFNNLGFRKLSIANAPRAIITIANAGSIYDLTVESCEVVDCQFGINLTSPAYMYRTRLLNNTLRRTTDGDTRLYIGGTDGVCKGNILIGTGTSGEVAISQTGAGYRWVVSDNTIINGNILDNGVQNDDCVFANNTITPRGTATGFYQSGAKNRCAWSGNRTNTIDLHWASDNTVDKCCLVGNAAGVSMPVGGTNTVANNQAP